MHTGLLLKRSALRLNDQQTFSLKNEILAHQRISARTRLYTV